MYDVVKKCAAYLGAYIAFCICACNQGYGTLVRYDLTVTPGCNDSRIYFAMVENDLSTIDARFRMRLMVPMLARVVRRGIEWLPIHVGTWNHTALAMLTVNATFTALTAILVYRLAVRYVPEAAALAPLVFLLSWMVVNSHLAGMVDSAETFFLTLFLTVALTKPWTQRGLGVNALCVITFGMFAKETIGPLATVGAFAMALGDKEKRSLRERIDLVLWTGFACFLGYVLLWRLSSATVESYTSALAGLADPWWNLKECVWQRTNIYAFVPLLAFAAFSYSKVPRNFWLGAVGITTAALALAVLAGIRSNATRPMWSALGPLLSIATAQTVYRSLALLK